MAPGPGNQQGYAVVIGSSKAGLLATHGDFHSTETEGGRRTFLTRWMHTYVDLVFSAALKNPDIFQTFFEVTHMIRPVSGLFAPHVIALALKQRAARTSR